jgi:hypothetical protein
VTGSWWLPSEDSATDWAQRALVAKNLLTASDARLLEVAFELRLCALFASEPAGSSVGSGSQGSSSFADADPNDVGNDQSARVDKSTLAVSAPPPLSRQSAPFAISPDEPASSVTASHPTPVAYTNLQPRALGRKASDKFAVPLCRIHHRLVHHVGNEAAWWKYAGIDPAEAARKLWNDTRMDQGRIGPGPTAQRPAADRTANPEQWWKMLMSSLAD